MDGHRLIVMPLRPFVVWALSGGSIPLALGVLQILVAQQAEDLFTHQLRRQNGLWRQRGFVC